MTSFAGLWAFARVCAVLAPVFLLVGDCVALGHPDSISWTLLLWLSFVCFIPALAGITIALSRDKPMLALSAGGMLLVGAMAGAAMQAYFRTAIVLKNGGHDAAGDFLRSQAVIPLTTQMPGIFFPLGLLLLVFGLWRSRATAAWLASTLALGAILFPIGHAVGVAWALIAGDLVLLVAFPALAHRLLRGEMSNLSSLT